MERRRLLQLLALSSVSLAYEGGVGSLKDAIAAEAGPHWGYLGSDNPEHWGELTPTFQACQGGSQQSPIDLYDGIRADLAAIAIDYHPIPLKLLNNSHTILLSVPRGNTLTLAGQNFQLRQFHFHHPSEHTLNHTAFPMEAHFVHTSGKGELMVLGVFLQVGATNPTLQTIWNHLPRQAGDPQAIANVTINPLELLPRDRTVFRYEGSLTTPPCSEIVHWLVFEQPLELSAEQVEQFAQIFPLNARPVQPLNRRFVLRSRG